MTDKLETKVQANEREACKLLSKHLGGTFSRSGKGNELVPPNDMGFLSVKVESFDTFPFHQLLQDCPVLDALFDGADVISHYPPMVMFKAARLGWYIAVKSAFDFRDTINRTVYRDIQIFEAELFLTTYVERIQQEFKPRSIRTIQVSDREVTYFK